MVPELLEGFPKRHPGVQLEIMIGTNEELLAALDAGDLDVALVYNVSLPAGYRRRRIYATELEVHLPPTHTLANAETMDLPDLADEPYIQYDASPGTRNVIDAFTARGPEPRIEARVGQLAPAEPPVRRGRGYGPPTPGPNPLPVSSEGRPVVIRPLDPPVTVSHVVGIWPADMTLTSRAEALLDFAVEKLGDYGRADVRTPHV